MQSRCLEYFKEFVTCPKFFKYFSIKSIDVFTLTRLVLQVATLSMTVIKF